MTKGCDCPGLQSKHRVVLGIPVGATKVELINNYRSSLHLPALGVVLPEFKGLRSRLDYDLRFGTVGAELAYKSLYVSYRADRVSLSRARA